MRRKLVVNLTQSFRPDPEAVRRAIAALIRLSDEARAAAASPEKPDSQAAPVPAATSTK